MDATAATSLRHLQFSTADMRLHKALKERVDAYFTRTGLSKNANGHMVRKTIFFAVSATFVWALLASAVLPTVAAVVACVVLGVLCAAIGFNIGHDAIHGAYSSKPWVNRVLSHSFDLIGASSFAWSSAHNFVHHTYTNIPGVDHDLEPGPFMHFYPHEKRSWVHRFQHIYAFALYTLTTIVWLWKKDFQQVMAPDPRSGKRAPTLEIVKMCAWKLLAFSLFAVVPVVVGGYAVWQVAIGYYLVHAAMGVTSAVVFQLAHVVEVTAFPTATDGAKMEDSFVAHQLRTTANFAPDSYAANFFCGGLNHQVEHHLFPKICHVHYPALAPIVRDTAREFGVPYHEFATFQDAFTSHVRLMKRFGRPSGGVNDASAPSLVLPAYQPLDAE